jgi:PRC-barrel domain
MKMIMVAALASALLAPGAVVAQTTVPASPPAAVPPAAGTPVLPTPTGPTLSDAEAKTWIDKDVYSIDGKKLGEVVAFVRNSAGVVSEMHAGVGGFLGLGETKVRLMPAQFKLMTDRVVLSVTSEQAKSLPKVTK